MDTEFYPLTGTNTTLFYLVALLALTQTMTKTLTWNSICWVMLCHPRQRIQWLEYMLMHPPVLQILINLLLNTWHAMQHTLEMRWLNGLIHSIQSWILITIQTQWNYAWVEDYIIKFMLVWIGVKKRVDWNFMVIEERWMGEGFNQLELGGDSNIAKFGWYINLVNIRIWNILIQN